jgi:hypothetical protein
LVFGHESGGERRKQQEFVAMGAAAMTAGASLRQPLDWRQLNWRRAQRNVRRLQIRIVQAEQE